MDADELAEDTLIAFQRAAQDLVTLQDQAESLERSIERAVEALESGVDVVDTPAIDGAAADLAAAAHRLVFRGGQINQLQNLALESE